MKTIDPNLLSGVWSATPTPFTNRKHVDEVAVKRLVEHHVRLGVKGLFLSFFLINATPDNVAALYVEAIRGCPLPVGIYDRGSDSAVAVTDDVLRRICAEPKVVIIKDSSADPERMKLALSLRRARPKLRLLNGDEFACPAYLEAGYDGLLLGGAIFNGRLAGMIVKAVHAGRLREADRLQRRMNRLMRDVYGGRKITCWMSGLKHLLVEMGLFRTPHNLLNYPLTPACKRAIAKALVREKEVLFP